MRDQEVNIGVHTLVLEEELLGLLQHLIPSDDLLVRVDPLQSELQISARQVLFLVINLVRKQVHKKKMGSLRNIKSLYSEMLEDRF